MDKDIDLVSIRLDAIKATYSRNEEMLKHIEESARVCDVSTEIIYLGLLLVDKYSDVLFEIKYARQCGLSEEKITAALRQSVADDTIQPLKMMYTDKGGGTE